MFFRCNENNHPCPAKATRPLFNDESYLVNLPLSNEPDDYVLNITRAIQTANWHTYNSALCHQEGVVAVGADNMARDAPKDVDPETGATLFGHVHLLT